LQNLVSLSSLDNKPGQNKFDRQSLEQPGAGHDRYPVKGNDDRGAAQGMDAGGGLRAS
jgi:hypothetical protein